MSHVDTPGAALTIDALFDRAWTGARDRVRARQPRQRRAGHPVEAGLRPLLQRTPAGYLLDPEVAAELTAGAAAGLPG